MSALGLPSVLDTTEVDRARAACVTSRNSRLEIAGRIRNLLTGLGEQQARNQAPRGALYVVYRLVNRFYSVVKVVEVRYAKLADLSLATEKISATICVDLS